MGGGCSCDRNPNNVSDPTQHNGIRNELEEGLAEFLDLSHPLNINKKYSSLFKIDSKITYFTTNSFRKRIYWK